VARLPPEIRSRALEQLRSHLSVGELDAYTAVVSQAVREATLEARNTGPVVSSGTRLSAEERAAYRQCLMVRAACYGGDLELPVFALASGVVPTGWA
jgi:hypothetical protein